MCDSLKSPYREIAISHFCKQMSVAEISQKEGKNPKTVQTQLYRAKSMLKKLLFQNDVMNTDEMISFLEHLDQCDYCLEQLIEHSEQDTQTVAPAYMKETIMKRATAPDTRARKAAVDTTHKMRIFYEGLRTVVGVALALVMLLSLGQANFFTPQVPKSATEATAARQEARSSLRSFSNSLTDGLCSGSQKLAEYINNLSNTITNGGN